jgi:hypothetical protein
MGDFPVIIHYVENGVLKSERVFLHTDKDVTKKVNRTREIGKYVKCRFGNYNGSLCFECDRGPSSCPKMADISSKLLSDYPFITDGFQVQDVYESVDDRVYSDSAFNTCEYEITSRQNTLRIDRFIVRGCKKFKNE